MDVAKDTGNYLVEKYHQPAPRYTSYPTVPYWDALTDCESWLDIVRSTVDPSEGLSLYIHLPFCESLCTYCACNTRITINHAVEAPYIEALCKEWDLWASQWPQKPLIREIHLGGGTPTFFSPENLKKLIEYILATSTRAKDYEFSFEAHPNYTSIEHLQALYDVGFRRLSFGIQDLDEKVQIAIHRIQPLENVIKAVEDARAVGYTSINFDLVYGLPFQTKNSLKETLIKSLKLKPDRIAFYSYAHVPWMKPGQRKFTEMDLPSPLEKMSLFEQGYEMFTSYGYEPVGMDHFSLPTDDLVDAFKNNTLHRNFMGYTTNKKPYLIGLGVSSISDVGEIYSQNVKTVEEYIDAVKQGAFPFLRGHLQTEEDKIIRRHILNIMCQFKTSWDLFCHRPAEMDIIKLRLQDLAKDGLIELDQYSLSVNPLGRPFLRNIALAFDLRFWRTQPQKNIFSPSI